MENKPTLEQFILELKDNKSSYYFYVPNTKGNTSGAVAYIYDMVAVLRENGYQAFILHDKEYMTPLWMGTNYGNLPHIPFEKVMVKPSDFLFLPEAWVESFFSDLKEQNIKLAWEVVIISQVYDLIFYNLSAGVRWAQFGIKNVITTSERQKQHIEGFMRNMDITVVNPYIHDEFKPSEKPQTPKIFLFTRDKMRGSKIEKEFHLKYPQYAWVPFVVTNNMDRTEFASNLKECCLSVWVDEISAFGTFPLESMKCGVPVIGKIPEMMPEWMGSEDDGKYSIKDNGIWLLNNTAIPDYIAQFLDEWFTDTLNPETYTVMSEMANKYNKQNFERQTVETLEKLVASRIQKLEEINKTINE
jgi:hypothetical protein